METIFSVVPNVFLNEIHFQRGIISVLKWDSSETGEIKAKLSAWLMREYYGFCVICFINDIWLAWHTFFFLNIRECVDDMQ